jgi:hypothetical protein
MEANRSIPYLEERLAPAQELMTIDTHARRSGDAPEPLYDLNVPTPTHAERARTLVAGIATGTLCTIAIEPAGYPYGSFGTVAFDEGNPVSLISALAEPTHNLERDARASLLVAEGGSDDPLANGRVTMLGECRRIAADRPECHTPVMRSWLFIRTHDTTRTFAASPSGSCMSTPCATSVATDGCRGYPRLTGTRRSLILSDHQPVRSSRT